MALNGISKDAVVSMASNDNAIVIQNMQFELDSLYKGYKECSDKCKLVGKKSACYKQCDRTYG